MSLFCPETKSAVETTGWSHWPAQQQQPVTRQFWCYKTTRHPCTMIYRRFRSEVFCRGRTASIFVTYCRAALLFWITRTVAVVIWWWDRVWFPFDVLQSWLSLKKNSGASMLMFIFLVWGMLILFMYLFLLFFFSYWLKKYYSNQNQFSAFQDLVNSLVKYIKIGAPVYFFPKSQDTT